ncbi:MULTISPECIES: hypothetical protein [Mycolicibacter]|uniref:Uncharacterized protein n=2 Tax=Mycolicibacter TaxID=1073531 RepID=A0ABU5XLG4_9MYCO|nr:MULTISPECIES: hypothetical protein [unclassified Mycolicibacter]MEB3023044.1 hypothetical protein [Mycolicibacter sp. MYC098]MEB3033554.1 hypothetical protein [Mycolicibacter sp. MYC340]
MTHTLSTTITGTTRTGADKDGNPSYTVSTTDGTWRTAPGSQVGFGITNSEFQGEVILTIDNDLIVGVSTPDGEHFTGRQS